ncbi:hypothetical protein ILYODFUR_023383 [Ilyodon furcidens]|uniref:Uncharacterized protein n=1 Tax=Ilyodon furcidens TaxID=33524 RepID=A0ABV0UKP3_9TELE
MHLVLARHSKRIFFKPLGLRGSGKPICKADMCLKRSPAFQPTAAMRARIPPRSDVKLFHLVLYDNHAVIAPKWLLRGMSVCQWVGGACSGALLTGVSDYLGWGPCVMSCQII